MKPVIPLAAFSLLMVIGGLLANSDNSIILDDKVSNLTHDAVVGYSHQMAKVVDQATSLSDKEAFDLLKNGQEKARNDYLKEILGGIIQTAAYGENDSEEFNSERFRKTLKSMKSGFERVK